MKIEKHVEAIKVKVQEKVEWVKENPKKAFKFVVTGVAVMAPSACTALLGRSISEKNKALAQKDQIILDQQQEINDLFDDKELYEDSIGVLQEQVLKDQGIIKKLASDLLRARRSLGGSMMNSFKNDSDLFE